jgi:hypothetical protein
MSFDVSGHGTAWSNFKLATTFTIGACSGSTELNIPGPGAITNSRFNVSTSGFSASGQLTSLTTATGSYSFVSRSIPNCGLLTQSGSWDAPPRPPDIHWTGTTSRGQPMSFDVSTDGKQWRNFKLKTDFVIGSCSGTTETTVPGPGDITSTQFSLNMGTYSFSGQFNSPTTASGSYSFVDRSITNCGTFSQTGTWTAQSP